MDKNKKNKNKCFFCPLGHNIMWHHGLAYKECPLLPIYRGMPECKDCNLRIDKKWEASKEVQKYKPNKKRKNRNKQKNKRGKVR